MPHGLRGERTLMRIHIGESDKHRGRALYQVIVETLRERGFAGTTVLRGIMGFGSGSKVVHSDRILRLSLDLPIVIEVVDEEEKIQAILPVLDEMVSGGLITMERVSVVLYRHQGAGPSRAPEKT